MKKIIILIMIIPFIYSDIAYFDDEEMYNYYSYGDVFNFEDEEITQSYYFITYNNVISLDTTEQNLYSSSYKYYNLDNNFYMLTGAIKINRFENSYPDSMTGLIFFYQPESDKSIRLVYYPVSDDSGNFRITQSDGLLICDNSITYTDNYSINRWIKYNIYVKNDSNIKINYKTWYADGEQPEFYKINCTLQTGNPSEFGTFGIFVKNASVDYTPINVTGYNIESSSNESISYYFDYSEILFNVIMVISIFSLLLYSLSKGIISLVLITSIMGILYGIYLLQYNFIIAVTVAIIGLVILIKIIK